MYNLENKVAIITGAASGMGKATVLRLLALDVKVIGFSLEADVDIKHNNFIYVKGSVTDYNKCLDVVALAVEKYQRIDILVNCAGITREGDLESTDVEEFKQTFDINVTGTFNMCKAAIPYLKNQPSSIVNIASDMGVRPLKQRVAYNPSKAAVVMLSRCIALDYAPIVRCNSILPGIVQTPMISNRLKKASDPQELLNIYNGIYAMNRIGDNEDITNAILYLISDQSKWVTGIELPVCGGPIS